MYDAIAVASGMILASIIISAMLLWNLAAYSHLPAPF
jgi:hypothetical protein